MFGPPPKPAGPHFAADYNAMVEGLLSKMPLEDVVQIGIGGNYREFGIIQRSVLMSYGLLPDSRLIDIGCGSGRTAFALRDLEQLQYVGTDVVELFLNHARKVCARPDWQFVTSPGLAIPAGDGWADMVCAFSLFTHLRHEETYVYMAEALRVLKPGGTLVFSFLDFAIAHHWPVFQNNVDRIGLDGHLTQFIDPASIGVWASRLGFSQPAIQRGDESVFRLPEAITLEDGSTFTDYAPSGQSLAVLRKPL